MYHRLMKKSVVITCMLALLPTGAFAQYVPVSANAVVATPAQDNILSESERCERLFPRYERLMSVPIYLLRAIALTESGRYHEPSSRLVPWPWTVNSGGKAYFADSRDEAAAIVKKLQARGIQNIDVGCMQVNLMYHGSAFKSVEDALEPVNNVAYAAKFLQDNFTRAGSWKQAVANYHSATPALGDAYATNVLRNWNQSMTDALAKGRIQYDKRSGSVFENSQVSGWDGVERYTMPTTPLPEWYYSEQEDAAGPYTGLSSDPAKLRRVMQKNPSDIIFVRVEHPAQPAAPEPQGQKVIYQRQPNATVAGAPNAVAAQPNATTAAAPNAASAPQQPNAVAAPAQPNAVVYVPVPNAVAAQPQQQAAANPPNAAVTDVSQTATTITINPPSVAVPPAPQQQPYGMQGYWQHGGQQQGGQQQWGQQQTQPAQPWMVFSNQYR